MMNEKHHDRAMKREHLVVLGICQKPTIEL